MTPLEQIIQWLKTFKDFDIFSQFSVDYTDNISQNGGIFPQGIVEISRVTDVLGNTITQNQANFGIYCVMNFPAQDTDTTKVNAQWIYSFQQWVQQQSVKGTSPTFGNTDTEKEQIKAQNGALYQVQDGTAIYMIQLSVKYKTEFMEDIWN